MGPFTVFTVERLRRIRGAGWQYRFSHGSTGFFCPGENLADACRQLRREFPGAIAMPSDAGGAALRFEGVSRFMTGVYVDAFAAAVEERDHAIRPAVLDLEVSSQLEARCLCLLDSLADLLDEALKVMDCETLATAIARIEAGISPAFSLEGPLAGSPLAERLDRALSGPFLVPLNPIGVRDEPVTYCITFISARADRAG